jgi:hypothetical protein
MTGARLHIPAGRHGQATALTTAASPQPGRRPFRPGDAERPEAALSGMPANSDPLLSLLPDRRPAVSRAT